MMIMNKIWGWLNKHQSVKTETQKSSSLTSFFKKPLRNHSFQSDGVDELHSSDCSAAPVISPPVAK